MGMANFCNITPIFFLIQSSLLSWFLRNGEWKTKIKECCIHWTIVATQKHSCGCGLVTWNIQIIALWEMEQMPLSCFFQLRYFPCRTTFFFWGFSYPEQKSGVHTHVFWGKKKYFSSLIFFCSRVPRWQELTPTVGMLIDPDFFFKKKEKWKKTLCCKESESVYLFQYKEFLSLFFLEHKACSSGFSVLLLGFLFLELVKSTISQNSCCYKRFSKF